MYEDKRVIIHKGIIDRFKFWLLGGNREVIYPDRVKYRHGNIISFPLWKRIYIRWFWKYRASKCSIIDGEITQAEARR